MEDLSIQFTLFGIEGEQIYIILGLILVLGLFIFGLIYVLLKSFTRKLYRRLTTFKQVVLLVTVPKYDIVEQGNKMQEIKTQQELAEKIAKMETFFANIAGLRAQRGIKYEFTGRTDHFSFEIVLKNGLIYFYVVTPTTLREYIEQQITAQFPDAQVEEVEDYNIFTPNCAIKGAMLIFKKEYIYPIKTYRKLENDSLNTLTNALSKLDKNSGVSIQYVIRSARGEWHKWGQKTASAAHQGKKLKEAIWEEKKGFSIYKINKYLKEWGFLGAKQVTGNQPEAEKHYQLSQFEQEIIKGIEEKAAKGGLDVNIRVVVSGTNDVQAQSDLDNIINSFAQFNIYEYGNAFKLYSPNKNKLLQDFIFREFDEKGKMIMNTEEMTSLFHFPMAHTETPNIVWLQSKKAAPPTALPQEGCLIGYNDFRNIYKDIYLTDDDRRRHVYIIGQTGTGKSQLQINMVIQDIMKGKGLCFIDPHGDTIDTIMQFIPKERAEDVIIFDPSDTDRPVALNMMEFERPEQKTLVINEMMNVFDKLYDLKATGGPIFEQYMRNTMLLMMDDPESGSTLLEISKVLSDPDFRKYKLSKSRTQVVKDFWIKEAEKAGGEASLANMVPYITSKLTSFIANDIMRPIVSQQKSAFSFREAMDGNKIILVKLSKGLIGEINANLLGMVIVGKILLAALSRVDQPENQRKDFYLYIDEFQNFLTEGIQVILSEARKYRLCLTIAHQFIGQLVKNNDTKFKDAIFGNVGSKVAFRVGVEDAEIFAKEFAPVFNQFDVMNVPNLNGFIKPLIGGKTVDPFSFHITPFEKRPIPNPELAAAIRELSRLKYGRDRNIVEAEIIERTRTATIAPAEDAAEADEEDFFA
ncbi:MAG: type IV secretion system DNA-binding domain-containing protein [Candidatus Parcubacteria bacterium]|nr:type IV secretion system DNA-binding domain-containing protein [Candidatus Parcubacteria bacterium]